MWRMPPEELYGGALRFVNDPVRSDMTTTEPTTRVREPPQARRRPAQLRQGDRGRARARSPRAAPRPRWRGSPAAPGVGIGTLYRHFPNRQALLEAVYVEEVERVCSSARSSRSWSRGMRSRLGAEVGRLHGDQDGARARAVRLRRPGRAGVHVLPRRAVRPPAGRCSSAPRRAGVVRDDTDFAEVIQLVGGIAKIQGAEPEQIDRILDIALDGLRRRRRRAEPATRPPARPGMSRLCERLGGSCAVRW